MRIKAFFGLSMRLCLVALIGCMYTEIGVELGTWLGYDPQFNSNRIGIRICVISLLFHSYILVILHVRSLFF